MNKKIFGGIAVLAVAVVATWNVNFSQTSGMSDVSLANVEALAQESGGGSPCYIDRDCKSCNIYNECGYCPCGSDDW